jgi:hypothetical protein
MRSFLLSIAIIFSVFQVSIAQSKTESEVLQLSKDKWQWMADKNVDKLADLFDAKAKFVHMSGTWKTPEELEIYGTKKPKCIIQPLKYQVKQPSFGTE